MSKKVALHTLGCKVNAYETEAMQQQLEEAGYEIVPFAPGADVYVINTCTVTNIADRKSRQMIHKAKKMNEEALVVVAGCYVQTAAEELKKDHNIDLIIGNNRKKDLVKILEEQIDDRSNPCLYMSEDAKLQDYEELTIKQSKEHTRVYIKVQDGCNLFCTYCIIPFARGRVRSRAADDIVREVEVLAVQGYQEVVLTGIHLSSYGVDFIKRGREEESLLSLIVKIHQVEGIRRIRLGSLEPGIITEEFVCTLADMKKVCPHFHLSLQSGSDAVLKRMNRRYLTGEFYEKCMLLREHFTSPALTTDIIAGFPGETEEEFQETVRFLERVNFYEVHFFKYSRRKGTKAADMPGQITEEIKAKRSRIMAGEQEKRQTAYEQSFIGQKTEVLFEEKKKIGNKEYFIGHTREYLVCAMESSVNLEGKMIRGTINGWLEIEEHDTIRREAHSHILSIKE